MNRQNLIRNYGISDEELNIGFATIRKEVSKIENKNLRDALFDFIENGDIGMLELELEENDEKLLIGDIVNIKVDSPDCGFPICGTYNGIVIEHHEVGLCIALHDMSVIEANNGEVYYPQFIEVSMWYNYDIKLIYREKNNWMEMKRLGKD